MVIGFAEKVPDCGSRGPSPTDENTSITSALPASAPTGRPPPMILPRVVRSGSTPWRV